MKKHFTFIICLFSLVLNIRAQNINISAEHATSFNGDSVTVSINTANFVNIGAVTVKVQYDNNVLSFGRALNWHQSMPGALAGNNGNKVILAWDGVEGANIPNGKMVDLKFKYISGNSNISFLTGSCEITDLEGNPLQVNYFDGSVSQTPTPNEPILITPLNNSQNQAVNLVLDWNDVPTAYTYNLQIALDSNFQNISLNQTNLTASYIDVNNLDNNRTYYWRVNATNPTGTSNWSVVYKFTTIVSIPSIPNLISPANGSINHPISINLKWHNSVYANNYHIEIATDSTFGAGIVFSDSTIIDTNKFVENLEFNKKYYWRVKAKNIAGFSLWSQIWSFSTIYKFSINGIIKYSNSQSGPLSSIKVYLVQNSLVIDSTISNTVGFYSFSNLINGTYEVMATTNRLWEGVNSTDALLIRRYSVGYIPFNIMQQKSADVNLSGAINSSDALDVRKRVIFIINSFAAGDWYFNNPEIIIDGSNKNCDIEGIIVGDINGSYNPNLLKTSNPICLSYADYLTTNINEEILYPIRISDGGLFGAITLELVYPKQELEFLGLDKNIHQISYNVADNRILLAWDDVAGKEISANSEFITLKFKQIANKVKGEFMLGDKCEFADIEGNIYKNIGITVPKLCSVIPDNFNISQNFPNPFNPETKIEYSLPEAGFVRLEVFNILGQSISVIKDEFSDAGFYSFTFNASQLSSGVYFYKIDYRTITATHSAVKKMIINK